MKIIPPRRVVRPEPRIYKTFDIYDRFVDNVESKCQGCKRV